MAKKASGYRGMMQKLEGTVGLYARRDIRDYALREVSLYARKGVITEVEKLQRKYQLSGLDAQRLHRSVKRRLSKIGRDAERIAGVVARKKEQRRRPKAALLVMPEQDVGELLPKVLEAIRVQAGDELLTKGEQSSLLEGFIYLLTHENYDGWIKAGMTIDYEMRLAVYNTGDPLCRYTYRAIKPVPERRKAERELLARLSERAEEVRGEWFQMSLDDAWEMFGPSWLRP